MSDTKNKTIETYDKIALKYSDSNFTCFWAEEFDKYKNIISGKKVIDVGCGAGRDAVMFISGGFDYTGIDASEGMLEVASEQVSQGTFLQMDFYKLNFPNDTFDGFWATASFLHIPKSEITAVLGEVKRVLKQGGVGFISIKEKTTSNDGLLEEDKYGGIARYFSFYYKDEFSRKLTECNLQVIDIVEHIEDDNLKTKWLCYFVKK